MQIKPNSSQTIGRKYCSVQVPHVFIVSAFIILEKEVGRSFFESNTVNIDVAVR